MAYATQSHVEARNSGRGTFSSTTKPTASQVGLFIEETAAILDQTLIEAGYDAPVATTAASAALLALRNYNSVGAAYLVECSAQTASGRREEFQKMWENALEMIRRDGLPGLTRGASGAKMPRTNSVASAWFFRDMVL